MAENLLIHTGNKEEKYRELLPQLQALVSSETNACTGDGTLKRCQYEFVAFHHIKADPEKVEGLLQGGGNICQIGDTIRFRAYQCL